MSEVMKSMKVMKPDVASTEAALSGGGLEFPHGLRVHLNKEVLEKLQLPKLPQVKDSMALHAIVEVVGVNIEERPNGQRDVSLDLQITDMELKGKMDDSVNRVAEDEQKSPEEKTLLV